MKEDHSGNPSASRLMNSQAKSGSEATAIDRRSTRLVVKVNFGPTPAKGIKKRFISQQTLHEQQDADACQTPIKSALSPALPNQIQPAVTLCNTMMPDTIMPDTIMPDTVMPDTVMPDTVMPDTTLIHSTMSTSTLPKWPPTRTRVDAKPTPLQQITSGRRDQRVGLRIQHQSKPISLAVVDFGAPQFDQKEFRSKHNFPWLNP